MRRALTIGTILVQLLAATAVFGWFNGQASASHTVSTATLQPPTNLAVQTGCSLLSGSADLSWTATPSTFATGYKIERLKGGVLEPAATATVTPRTATSLVQTGLTTDTTYTWRIYAYRSGWTSTAVEVTAKTPSLCLI